MTKSRPLLVDGSSRWRTALLGGAVVLGGAATATWFLWEPAPTPASVSAGVSIGASASADHMAVWQAGTSGAVKRGAEPPQPASPSAKRPPNPERNAGIDPQTLTSHRLQTAKMFLQEVAVRSDPRGGYLVTEVDPGSLYAEMGLKPGDRVFSIDTPATSDLDDKSPEEAMKQDHVELEVYRDSGFVLLTHAL